MYHGPRGVPRPWGVPWPSRGVPWPLYEDHVLELSYLSYSRATWLRGIDADVQSANIGIHSAWRKVKDSVLWRRIIDTATLHKGDATEELL